MNKRKYKSTIYYTMDRKHPDYYTTKNKKLDFTDIYTFTSDYTEEECINFIKSDLQLVAGGGYNAKHIYNIKFNIEKLEE